MRTYVVTLTDNQRNKLNRLMSRERTYKSLHAQILLGADSSETGSNLTDEAISQTLDVSESAIKRICQCFVEQGMKAALNMENWHKSLGPNYKTLEKVYEEPPPELSWKDEFEPLYLAIKKELKEEARIRITYGSPNILIKLDHGEKREIYQMKDGKLHVSLVRKVRETLKTAGVIHLKISQSWWRQMLPW